MPSIHPISPELEQLDPSLSPKADGAESKSNQILNWNQTQGLSPNPNLSLSVKRVEFVKENQTVHLEENCNPLPGEANASSLRLSFFKGGGDVTYLTMMN